MAGSVAGARPASAPHSGAVPGAGACASPAALRAARTGSRRTRRSRP